MQTETSTAHPELDIKTVELTSPSKQMRLVDARYLQTLEEIAQRTAQNLSMAGPLLKIPTVCFGTSSTDDMRELILRLSVFAL